MLSPKLYCIFLLLIYVIYRFTGFKLVKQNQFAKISERSEEKDLPQGKKFLDLQIILRKMRRV